MQKFGKIVSVHIVKDKKTSEGRGLAFVKFERAYDAAIALENCDSRMYVKHCNLNCLSNDSSYVCETINEVN